MTKMHFFATGSALRSNDISRNETYNITPFEVGITESEFGYTVQYIYELNNLYRILLFDPYRIL